MFNITQNLRRVITLFFSFLIVVVVSLFYFVGEKKAYETIEEEASDAMLKTVLQVAQSIDYQIKTKFAILESIANSHFINDSNETFSIDTKLQTLELEHQRLSKLEFKRFGILDTQGIAHYTNGRTLYLGDQEHFKKALKGENAISKVLISQYEKAPIFAYTTPIRYSKTNEVSGVLFAAMDAQRLSEIASSIAYGKSGYAIIIDKNGQIIGHKEFSKVLESLNVLDKSNMLSPSFENIVLKMTQGLSGKGKFLDNDEEWSVAYALIPTTGWSIAILAPEHEINERAGYLTHSLLVISLFILVIALIFSYILAYYITIYQEKLENEKSEKVKELLYAHDEYEKILKITPQEFMLLMKIAPFFPLMSVHVRYLDIPKRRLSGRIFYSYM
ncbi:MAG: cache domain-containing protein [Campylobacteraceae bacterium]|nr:cache domain-containing protein [Campylobacteraceae bacterium]